MDFKEYPSYKDSGVEWLGEVPEHWKILQTRHLFSFGKGLTITKENLSDEGIPCINYGEIHSKYGFEFNPSDNPLKCVSHDYIESNKNCLLNEGDFIFADTSEDLEGSGNFSYLNQESIVFAGYHSIIARLKNHKNNARFFAYLFDSQAYRNQVRTEMKGVKVFSVSQGVLKSRFAWLPPNEEQVKIVSFLDSETSRIDNLIAKQEKLIETLEEHRKSVISHAVTKGLDPNVPMKDSGSEWLGEVPRHWILKPIKFLSKINQSTLAETTDENLDIQYVDIGSVSATYGIEKIEQYVFSQAPSRARRIVADKDIIVSTVRTYLKAITYIENPPKNLIVSTGFAVLTPIERVIKPQFAKYAFLAEQFIAEVISKSKGISYPAITASELAAIKIALPPLSEQVEIVKLLDEKSSKIDTLIAKQRELITKLKSYRTSIISHAVTGKIDVRDLVA